MKSCHGRQMLRTHNTKHFNSGLPRYLLFTLESHQHAHRLCSVSTHAILATAVSHFREFNVTNKKRNRLEWSTTIAILCFKVRNLLESTFMQSFMIRSPAKYCNITRPEMSPYSTVISPSLAKSRNFGTGNSSLSKSEVQSTALIQRTHIWC